MLNAHGEGPSAEGLASHDGSYNSLNRLAAMAQNPSEKPLEPEEKWDFRVLSNAGELPEFLREELTFENNQMPILLSKVICALYREEEKSGGDDDDDAGAAAASSSS